MKKKHLKRSPKEIKPPECKRIYILGGSILKHVQVYEISKSLENCKIYVKSFSGAKIRDT